MRCDYLSVNKKAYDLTAEEFQDKVTLRDSSTNDLVSIFSKFVPKHSRILELGPGSGAASRLLSEYGYNVTAIEFSEKMAQFAQKVASDAHVINDEFLAHNFGREKYEGVFAVAFIHLFTKEDVHRVLHKVLVLLNKGGCALLSTTLHEKYSEGFKRKNNFSGNAKRFRIEYTEKAFRELLSNTNCEVVHFSINKDPEVRGKSWMAVVIRKNK